jgi:hypothetical protein
MLATRPLGIPALQYTVTVAVGVSWLQYVAQTSWTDSEIVTATSVGAGAVALVAAIRVRTGRFEVPSFLAWGSLALVSNAVAWVAAADADGSIAIEGWWPAAGLVAIAGAALIAVASVGPNLHYAIVSLIGWSWVALALGLEWSSDTTIVATELTFGLLAVTVAEVARLWPDTEPDPAVGLLRVDVALVWGALATVGVFAGIFMAGNDTAAPIWTAVGAGLGLLAMAMVRGAAALNVSSLREFAAILVIGSVNAFAYGLEASSATLAIILVAVGLTATMLSLYVWRLDSTSLSIHPLAIMATIASLEAAIVAASLLPRRDILVAAILALGVETIAAGITLNRPRLALIGPPVVFATWLVAVGDSIGGNPQWYTTPIALTVLAEVELARWARRIRALNLGVTELLALEWAGVGLLILTPLTQMFTDGVVYGVAAFAASVGLLIWAMLTRVRRRVISALVLATVSAVLWVTVAASVSAPSGRFWITTAGVGFAALFAIALIESYRSKSGRMMSRIDRLMEGWE